MLSVNAVKRRGTFELNVDFEMRTPGVVALFGRSGCGKSTLVNILAGLLSPDAGRISLDDEIWHDSSSGVALPAERRRIGYVFQDARLFPHMNVAANLRYARRRASSTPYVSFDDVVELLAVAPLLARRPHQLSGGEKQRVAIGRALLTQPRLLLLDEPLAGLDRAKREELLPYLEKLRDTLNVPMVYVTHNFAEVLRLATSLVLMESGSVIARGGLGAMCLDPQLRSLIGRDEVGAIVDGVVLGAVENDGLTRIRVGDGELKVQGRGMVDGAMLRVQLLARDIIISIQPPQLLSVRNSLAGTLTRIEDDGADADLVFIDVGATRILARITKAATRDLSLRVGMQVWALVKAVSLRPRRLTTFTSVESPDA